jgi:succinoglycan biosynthesis transport protein ExoP
MTIETLLQALKSRLWLLLLLPLAAGGTALALLSDVPPAYSANARILIDYRKPLEGELAGELLPVGLQSSYLTTQIDIIESRPVAERVLETLKLRDSAPWRERFASEAEKGKDFDTWTIDSLLEGLTGTTGAESRVLNVWYRDPDPQMAASIANAFVESYRQTIGQIGRNPASENAQSVEKILANLRTELERAENKVSAYQKREGIMATEERLDVETAHLNELLQEKLAAGATLRAVESRLSALEDLLAQDKLKTASMAADLVDNGLIQGLNIEIARKEAERAERATSLGARHPEMRRIDAEIESLRERLTAETAKAVSGLRGEVQQAQRLAEAAEQAEAAQRRRLMEMKHGRDGPGPLLRELESARSSYDRALGLYSEYAMHSQLSQTNVALLDPARAPALPSTPNALASAAAAAFAGLVLAIGMALLWELADRRVRGTQEIERIGDAGHLGALPPAS